MSIVIRKNNQNLLSLTFLDKAATVRRQYDVERAKQNSVKLSFDEAQRFENVRFIWQWSHSSETNSAGHNCAIPRYYQKCSYLICSYIMTLVKSLVLLKHYPIEYLVNIILLPGRQQCIPTDRPWM